MQRVARHCWYQCLQDSWSPQLLRWPALENSPVIFDPPDLYNLSSTSALSWWAVDLATWEEWKGWIFWIFKGVWMGPAHVEALHVSTLTSSSPAPHIAVHINSETFVSCCPHYFKQSRICTDINTCINYILWAELYKCVLNFSVSSTFIYTFLVFWLSTQACKSFPSLSWRLIGVLCKAERKQIVMVQPKVFLWEPAWIPWWLHFKKPSELFRSCCNIPIRATTIIHYRLFHSNFPVSSFFLLVVKSFRGNIELHWPPPLRLSWQ